METVLNQVEPKSSINILELGTGSGCIAISLLLNLPYASVTATDICNDALQIALQNAIKHKVRDRIKLLHSNWFDNLKKQKFDIIVSNPPYIAANEKTYMSYETLKYEPYLALFAKKNGLSSYYTVSANAKKFLTKNGKLFLEIGFNQYEAVKEIFITNNYKLKQFYKDLAGHTRVIVISEELVDED